MMKNDKPTRRVQLSRRDFLKVAAAAGWLVGCQSPLATLAPTSTQKPSVTPIPTDTPVPTDVPPPSPTIVPTSTDVPIPANTPVSSATPNSAVASPEQVMHWSDLVKIYPETNSKVVHTRHPGWEASVDVPGTFRQMLDASLTALTDIESADVAWATLFAPTERIAIKVNVIGSSSYWTHLSLVLAVAERLQSVGVPSKNIVIFDRDTAELRDAGYPVNRSEGAVQCYGTDGNETSGYKLLDTNIKLSNVLLDCDALINIPVLKHHGMAGISFAMKNHYGTFDKPWEFHRGKAIRQGMAALNALPAIKERTRLVIGDALRVIKSGWHAIIPGDSILMSFDPVAHDAVGLRVYSETMEADGRSATDAQGFATPWLDAATDIEVGTNNFDHIDVVELNL